MRYIFLKCANTVKPLIMHLVATGDFCKLKSVYSISIIFSNFVFRFIQATLYLSAG
jgi:hypothetical protein